MWCFKRKMLNIAAVFFIGCSIYFYILSRNQITETLKKIPQEKRFFLEAFLRSIILEDGGCYVLFGDKPAALMHYLDIEGSKLPNMDFSEQIFDFAWLSLEQVGYKIWCRSQKLFTVSKYALIRVPHCWHPGRSVIILVHKQRLERIIREHWDDFRIVFPQFVSWKELTNALFNNTDMWQKITRMHEPLLGVILGYGKQNAEFYQRKTELTDYLFPVQKHWVFPVTKSPIRKLMARPPFTSLAEEYSDLEAKSGGLVDPTKIPNFHLTLIHPVGFLVDVSQTNIAEVRMKYACEYREVARVFQKGNFLETILQELTAKE